MTIRRLLLVIHGISGKDIIRGMIMGILMKNKGIRTTRKQKSIISNSYELMVIIDDLILAETDDDKKEKLRLIRKGVCKIVSFDMSGYTKEK